MEYRTIIKSNGSKWAGESPDDIQALLNCLASNTLDPTFEHYGNFISHPVEWLNPNNEIALSIPNATSFFGNFFDCSHVFNIYTNDPKTIDSLTQAIRANQQTEAYAKAREERIEQDRAISARKHGDSQRLERWAS